MKKIILLSLSLIALVLFVNTTKAATTTSDVQLEITSVDSTCTSLEFIDLGSEPFSYGTITFTGDILTSSTGNEYWICEDTEGFASREITLHSTDVINMTTPALNANWTIASGNVDITSAQATVTDGNCTINSSLTTSQTALNTPVTVMEKTSALGEICKVEIQSTAELRVTTNSDQPLGVYSGTLTLDTASF